MGIEGAAIGTLASFAMGAAAILFTLFTRSGAVKLVPLDGPSLSSLSPVVRLSIPAFGEKIAFHTAFVIFAAYVGHLGALEMSANQALIAIESLGFMVAHGFSIAASALVAQKLGAQRPDEATAVGWISAGLGAAVLGVVGLLFWFFPATFLGWFTDNPALIEMGVPCLKLAAAIQPVMAICDAMSGSLRGAGDTRTPMLAAFIGRESFASSSAGTSPLRWTWACSGSGSAPLWTGWFAWSSSPSCSVAETGAASPFS